jgi:hypothetical protein
MRFYLFCYRFHFWDEYVVRYCPRIYCDGHHLRWILRLRYNMVGISVHHGQ